VILVRDRIRATVVPQAGLIWQFKRSETMANREPIKVLFVCSMNQWRSPTAEKIYADNPLVSARSAGTNKGARKSACSGDLVWADLVLLMEQKHKQRLLATFPSQMKYKPLHVLDIPDDYKYVDPELVEEITSAVGPLIENFR